MSSYFMPKCAGCKKRYKVTKDKCITISFSYRGKDGSYRRDTEHFPKYNLCPTCYQSLCDDYLKFLDKKKEKEGNDK